MNADAMPAEPGSVERKASQSAPPSPSGSRDFSAG